MSDDFTKADHEAAGIAMDRWTPDSRDGKSQAFYDGFKAGCQARRTPGPATAKMLEWCKTTVDWFDNYPGMSAKGRPEDHVNMATFRAFIAEHEPA